MLALVYQTLTTVLVYVVASEVICITCHGDVGWARQPTSAAGINAVSLLPVRAWRTFYMFLGGRAVSYEISAFQVSRLLLTSFVFYCFRYW